MQIALNGHQTWLVCDQVDLDPELTLKEVTRRDHVTMGVLGIKLYCFDLLNSNM
jgi:hypothetical protein